MSSQRRRAAVCVAITAALAASNLACASLIKGSGQEVMMTSAPPGAAVYVDGQQVGVTPMTRRFSHGDRATVAMRKPGYEEARADVTSSFSGHTLWLLFWSLLVDAAAGNVATIDQDSIHATLSEDRSGGGRSPPPQKPSPPPAPPVARPLPAPSVPQPKPRSRPKRREGIVAVFDVRDAGKIVPVSELAQLGDYVGTRLTESCGYSVVPRAAVKRALEEAKAESYKACYDESCQIELGKAVAAQKSLATRIIKVGSRCALGITLIDLTTEATEASATTKTNCSVDSLIDAVDQAMAKLCATH